MQLFDASLKMIVEQSELHTRFRKLVFIHEIGNGNPQQTHFVGQG